MTMCSSVLKILKLIVIFLVNLIIFVSHIIKMNHTQIQFSHYSDKINTLGHDSVKQENWL